MKANVARRDSQRIVQEPTEPLRRDGEPGRFLFVVPHRVVELSPEVLVDGTVVS